MGYVPSPHTVHLRLVCVLECMCDTSVTALAVFQDTVSVHRPSFYADRFLKFMGSTVFRKLHRKTPHDAHLTPRPPPICHPRQHFKPSLRLSALRGASSKRKKGSLYAGKSASQEALSPTKEEKKEEKKAQSMEQLDANCEHKTALFHIMT